MRTNRVIQLKAIFLLAVFALNTLVGFACAVGLNMGFNTKHHHPENPVAVAHHHHEGAAHHHHATKTKHSTEEGNCCNDGVIKFSQSDKLIAQAVNAGAEMPLILVQLHFIYQSSYVSSFTTPREQTQVVRPYVLSARGIRVSIQSFQI